MEKLKTNMHLIQTNDVLQSTIRVSDATSCGKGLLHKVLGRFRREKQVSNPIPSSLVVVSGEPGAGKTLLVQALGTHALHNGWSVGLLTYDALLQERGEDLGVPYPRWDRQNWHDFQGYIVDAIHDQRKYQWTSNTEKSKGKLLIVEIPAVGFTPLEGSIKNRGNGALKIIADEVRLGNSSQPTHFLRIVPEGSRQLATAVMRETILNLPPVCVEAEMNRNRIGIQGWQNETQEERGLILQRAAREAAPSEFIRRISYEESILAINRAQISEPNRIPVPYDVKGRWNKLTYQAKAASSLDYIHRQLGLSTDDATVGYSPTVTNPTWNASFLRRA